MDDFGLGELVSGLDANEIPELPTLPFGDLTMSMEGCMEDSGNQQFGAWEGQHVQHGLAPRPPPGKHPAAQAAEQGAAVDWATPPASVSPQFSVTSSPERGDSDSDEGGTMTPPKQQHQPTVAPADAVGEPRPQALKRTADCSAASVTGAEPLLLGPLVYDAKAIEAQREQRLRRNREAAQQFRKRKKEYVNCLEADCHRLRQENMQIRAQLSTAQSENTVLREENGFYKNLVNGRAAIGVSARASGPRVGKVAKVAGATMMGMMMVVALVTNTPMQSTGVGGSSTAVSPPTLVSAVNTHSARRRMMAVNNTQPSGPAVPMPGMVWNGSAAAASELPANLSDPQKWLSLLHPREDYSPSGTESRSFEQAEWLGQLHSGYIQRDDAGDWSMDWAQLQRFGRTATPHTRYIFCPDAQDLSSFSEPPVRRRRKDTPDVIQLLDDDVTAQPVPKGNEVATVADVQRLELEAIASSEDKHRSVAQLAIAERAAVHPPDFDPEELEAGDESDWSADEGFGVSLLIPTAANSNESTPVVQMVEFRCEVANVTRHTFVE